MSSELVKSQIDLLNIIAKPKNKYRKVILSKADKKLVTAICQCVHNLLAGNINISEENKNKLKKFKSTLRKLIQKSSLQQKRNILVQRGGFLEYLIPAVITGISSIISSAINS